MELKFKSANIVKLLGDIVDVTSDTMRIRTVQRTIGGTEYEEFHEVHCDNHSKKVGDRIKLFGHMKTIETELGPKTVIACSAENIKKALKKERSKNICKIIGKNPFSFQFFPRAEGKQAFGNLLVVSDVDDETGEGQFHRGVFFGNLAHVFSRNCTKQSIVQLIGRLRNREYKDSNDEFRTILEIMVDDDQTKILRKGVLIDEFAEFEANNETPVPAI